MKLWQQKLNEIPTDKDGKKDCSDSLSASIVFIFFEEEIYPRFEKIKSEFSNKDLKIDISPLLPDDVSSNHPSVSIYINKKDSHGCSIYSLRFNKGSDYPSIDSTLIGKNGNKTLGVVAIGVTDEHNTIELVDLCFESLSESIK